MNKLVSEQAKVDIALTSAALNGAGTGAYYNMSNYRKALFAVEIGAMSAASTSIMQVMQAQDAAATGAKVVTNNAATITANTGVAAATLTVADVQVGDEVTINGTVFTGAAAAVPANQVYLADDTDNNATAASLAAVINAAGLGITATSAAAVVTLVSSEPGEVAITITDDAGTITPATLRAIGYVECDASFIDLENGFTHLALRVTNSAAMQTGAVLIRGNGRYSPVQAVAAAKTDVLP